ncbi:hypothetical protein H6G76_01545 [Nostoc sp. FACHB-152]|uniref:nSTAND1 domain-containing NTPase n=1 Tax=unclassified Nostoc TaxID=2593658 RepID=UPI001683EABF|nr:MULTISPECIES: hypothetical protein [unclassified Nostoc]MBD2445855.1 hypothetical protein [Nostoc sp. FACHB-152]MBD2467969.1 hypothetical protein [Nostoc sp. FACHB-145]
MLDKFDQNIQQQHYLAPPYKGLDPYTEEDALFFFGRDKWQRIITDNLLNSRLTVLYGESGVGKSSLLHAGIANRLRVFTEENRKESNSPKFAVVVFKNWNPQLLDSPKLLDKLLKQSQKAVAEALGLDQDSSSLERRFQKPICNREKNDKKSKASASSEFIQELQVLSDIVSEEYWGSKLLIILDQFEDYFSYYFEQDEGKQFIKELANVRNYSTLNVNFLIAIRSDAYYKLEELKGYLPSIVDNCLELKHLDRKSAEEAIQKPLARYNCRQTIINRLKEFRLTVLAGESNVGKSFMLRKGVVPYLDSEVQESLEQHNSPILPVVLFDAWEDNPLSKLIEKIKNKISLYLDQESKDSLSHIRKLDKILKAWDNFLKKQQYNGKLLIIFDHFEEYFRHLAKPELFAESLNKILTCDDLPVHCLISIREDNDNFDKFGTFISNLKTQISAWDEQYFQLSKDSLWDKSFKDKKQRSPNSKTVDFKDSLVNHILDKLTDKKSEASQKVQIAAPYLQIVMTRLWEEREEVDGVDCITFEKFENLGFVEGIVKEYVSTRIEKLFPEEDQDKRRTAMQAKHVLSYFLTPSLRKNLLSVTDLVKYAQEESESLNLPTTLEEEKVNGILNKLSQARILRSVGLSPPRYELYLSQLAPAIQEVRTKYIQYVHSLTIAQRLPTESIRQLRRRRDDLAALLALEAYNFNKEHNLGILDQVDEALREALSVKHFSITLKGHQGGVTSVAFSPDGRLVASGSHDGQIGVWQLTPPYEHQPKYFLNAPNSVQGVDRSVWSVTFHPDEQQQIIVAGKDYGNVELWNLKKDLDPQNPQNPDKILWTHHYYKKQDNGKFFEKTDHTCIFWLKWHQKISQEQSVEKFDLWAKSFLYYLDSKSEQVKSVVFNKVKSVVFNRDGSILASGGEDGKIQLVNLHQTEHPNQSWEDYANSDDDFLINLLSGFTVLRVVEGEKLKEVLSLAFDPQKNRFVSGHNDGTIWLWNWNSHSCNYEHTPLSSPHNEAVKSLAFSPDGKKLASGSADRTIRLWNLDDQDKDLLPDMLGQGVDLDTVNSVAFLPDGKHLISGGEDQKVRLWNVEDFKLIEELPGQYFGISSVAFALNKKWIAAGSWDNTVRLWNLLPSVTEPKEIQAQTKRTHEDNVMSVAYNSEQKMLASASWDKKVQLWTLNSFDEPQFHKTLIGHNDYVWSVTFSQDGKLLASSGTKNDKTVRLWNLENLDGSPIILTDEKIKDGISSVAFSPDCKILAAGVWDDQEQKNDTVYDTVFLWDLSQLDKNDWEQGKLKNQKVISLPGHGQSITSIAFLVDENKKILATASNDSTIRLWDLSQLDWGKSSSNAKYCVLKGHTKRVWSVAFHPTEKILASGSDDTNIRLWNLKDLDQLNWRDIDERTPEDDYEKVVILSGYNCHNYWVASVVFSHDGNTLASGSFDGTIRLWNIETASKPDFDWQQKEYKVKPIVLRGHEQSVTSVVFITTNSGEKRLASGSYDNTVRLWITSTDRLAAMVKEQVPRILTAEERKRFIGSENS